VCQGAGRLAGPTIQPLTGWLHGATLQEAVEGDPKPKIGGGQTLWPAGQVARLAGHHLACPWTPINTSLSVKINAKHTTCSSSLVNVLV
jgi:hypothetical protein